MARSIVLNLIGNDRVSPAVRRVGQEMDRAADRAGNLEQALGRLDGVMAAVGAGAGAALAGAMVKAVDLSAVQGRLQAQLGLTQQESARVGAVAGRLYAQAYGESMDDVRAAIASVIQHMDGMRTASADTLEQTTARAMTVARVLDEDVGRVTAAVTNLLRTGLAKSSAEAFDILTKGAQIGANRAGDLLDTFEEYAVQFQQLGFTGQQALGLINQMLQSGARNTDLAADTLKEFIIEAAAGGDKIVGALKEMGLNAGDLVAKFAAGGPKAAQAFDLVMRTLRGIEDPLKRNQIAVDLFGTKAEDVQRALLALDPSTATRGLEGLAGATDRAGQAMQQTAAAKVEQFKRSLEQNVTSLLAESVIPRLEELWRTASSLGITPAGIVTAGGALLGLAAAYKTVALGARIATAQIGRFSIANAVATSARNIAGFVTGLRNVNAAFAANATLGARLGAALRSQIMLWRQQAAAAGVSTARIIAQAAAQRAAAVATRVWAAAQAVFNAVMRANPIVLVVTLLAALGVAVVAAYRKFEWFRNLVDAVWRGTRAAAEMAWAGIRVVFSAIASFISATLGPVFSWLYRNVVVPAFRGTQIAVTSAWAVIKQVFNLLMSWVGNTLVTAFKNFLTGTRTAWNGARSAISTVWNSGIRPVFDRLRQAVGKVRDAFRVAVDGIRVVWNKLKGIAKTPVNFVIGIYNDGIVRLVNGLAKLVGLGQPLSKIPKFARGGVMPGYAPGRDTLIAAVSPGESIFRPEFTKAVGEDFVYAANRIARTGGPEAVRKWLTGPHALGGEGLAFARGGVVPGFAGAFGLGGVVKGFIRGVRDFAIGNVGAAAKKLLDRLIGNVPGSGLFRDMIAKVPVWIRDKILGWIKNKIDSGVGGVRVQRALQWARSQAGKPYVWGGVGPGGYDCSGFMSAITNVIQGRSPYSRRFTTFSFTGAPQGPAGFRRNLRSGFMVGITNRGVGHMAGTLAGVPVESAGSAGVRVGPSARSATNAMFDMRYGLKFDRGGWLPPGWSTVYNGLGRPEPVFPSLEAAEAAVGGKPLVGEVHVHHVPGYSTPQDVVRGLRRAELAARYPRRR